MSAFGDDILVPVAGFLALVVSFGVGEVAFRSGLVADSGAIHAVVSCHGIASLLGVDVYKRQAIGLSKRLNLEVPFAFAEQLPVGPKLVFVKRNPDVYKRQGYALINSPCLLVVRFPLIPSCVVFSPNTTS